MLFAHTWSSFSWSLNSFFCHAQRKSWFHIVFYSIFEPWAPLDKLFARRLFHFLSWAIFKNHWFSFGFPMFFAHTWSSFSWSLKSNFLVTHDENLDFLYSIFEPRAPVEKLSFFDFFTFSRKQYLKIKVFLWFLLIHDLHFHDLSSHFLVTHDENLDFILFFTALLSPGHLRKNRFSWTTSLPLVCDFFKSLVFLEFSHVFCSYMIFIWMISQKSKKKTKKLDKKRKHIARRDFWKSLVFPRFSYVFAPHKVL